MNFAIGLHAPTIGAVCWSICSEISSLELRSQTQGLAMVANAIVSWSLSFATPYLINTDQGEFGFLLWLLFFSPLLFLVFQKIFIW